MMQGWYYEESLTGQRHNRVQTESQIATVDSCFDLVARCSKLWSIQLVDWYSQAHYMQMVMTSDETQIIANWPMSHAKRMTRDNRKNPQYRVVSAMRKLRTDTSCPAEISWPNHVKNEQHIGSEKTYGPQNTEQLNIMMQRTANENAACLRRICKWKKSSSWLAFRNGYGAVQKVLENNISPSTTIVKRFVKRPLTGIFCQTNFLHRDRNLGCWAPPPPKFSSRGASAPLPLPSGAYVHL